MSRSQDGLTWTDEIPLLEQIADFQGRPGGIAGLEYAYVPLDQVMDLTSAPPITTHLRSGKPIPPADLPQWKWTHASNEVFRIIDSATAKQVDFQILKRGIPLHGSCPGWYRVPTYVHPALLKWLGWGGNQARRLLGQPTEPEPTATQPAAVAAPMTVAKPTTQQRSA